MAVTPELPIPVSLISDRYFLFSADAVSYIRREFNISGVLGGTLPQIPQQNVFLGLPLQLMPEEARLLVDKNVAYIINDTEVHKEGLKNLREQDCRRYFDDLNKEGTQASAALTARKEQRREEVIKKLDLKKTKKKDELDDVSNNSEDMNDKATDQSTSAQSTESAPFRDSVAIEALGITPATSRELFSRTRPPSSTLIPAVPSSYPLFAHLHSKGYFLSPGLRFGCQYMAYPGDSLRFHSHFLVVSAEWDEELDLMDLVVGGRLGTGVKKGFLIGGAEKTGDVDTVPSVDAVRTFSLEWAGM